MMSRHYFIFIFIKFWRPFRLLKKSNYDVRKDHLDISNFGNKNGIWNTITCKILFDIILEVWLHVTYLKNISVSPAIKWARRSTSLIFYIASLQRCRNQHVVASSATQYFYFTTFHRQQVVYNDATKSLAFLQH